MLGVPSRAGTAAPVAVSRPSDGAARRGLRRAVSTVRCCAGGQCADNLPVFSMSNKPRPADIDEIEEYIRMTLTATVPEKRETFSVINVNYDRVLSHFPVVSALELLFYSKNGM